MLLLLPAAAQAATGHPSPLSRPGYWELEDVHAEPLGGSRRVIQEVPSGAWRLFVSAAEDGGEAQALFEPAAVGGARPAGPAPPTLARWLLTWTPPPGRLAPGETWSTRIATSAGGTGAPVETDAVRRTPIPRLRAEWDLVAHRHFTDVVLGTLWERSFDAGVSLEAPRSGSASLPLTWTVPGWAPVLESYATDRDRLPLTIRVGFAGSPDAPGSEPRGEEAEVAITWRYRWIDVSETVDLAVRAVAASHAAASDAGYRIRAPEASADRHHVFVLVENRGGAHPVHEARLRAWDGRPGDSGSRALGEAVTLRDLPAAPRDDRFAWVVLPVPLASPLEVYDLWVEATVPSQVDLDPANNIREAGRVRIVHLRRGDRAYAVPRDAHSFAAYPATGDRAPGTRWIDAHGLPSFGPAMTLAAAEAFLRDGAVLGGASGREEREPVAARSRTGATDEVLRAAALLESAASTAPTPGSRHATWTTLEREITSGKPGLLLVNRDPRTALLLAYKLVDEGTERPRRTIYVADPEWPSERLGLRPDPYVTWREEGEEGTDTEALLRARQRVRTSAPEYVSWGGETEAWAAWPIGRLVPNLEASLGTRAHGARAQGTAGTSPADSTRRRTAARREPTRDTRAVVRYTAPDGSYSFPLPQGLRPVGRNPRGDLDLFHARDSGPFLHAARGPREIEDGAAEAWWDQAARMLEQAYGKVETTTIRVQGREARVFGYPGSAGTYTVWQAHIADGRRMFLLTWGERSGEGPPHLPEAFAALLRDLAIAP